MSERVILTRVVLTHYDVSLPLLMCKCTDCWTMPYVIHAAVSAVSMVVFVVLSATFQMGELELNMATKNLLGMAHSR